MKRQTLLFDLDDTLVHCNIYFVEALDRFADRMVRWFAEYPLSRKEAKAKQLELDMAGIAVHGFSDQHFPQSLVDTYRHFSRVFGRSERSDEIEELMDIGRSVFARDPEPYPHMMDTLVKLQAEGHRLYLHTGGIREIQLKKVRAAKLERFFEDRIYVWRHKTADALAELIASERLDRNSTWMIGNSYRTDIVPALKTGINAIHVPAVIEWAYNIVEIDVEPQRAFVQVERLSEVPSVIRRYALG